MKYKSVPLNALKNFSSTYMNTWFPPSFRLLFAGLQPQWLVFYLKLGNIGFVVKKLEQMQTVSVYSFKTATYPNKNSMAFYNQDYLVWMLTASLNNELTTMLYYTLFILLRFIRQFEIIFLA
jgi:hypothetical protein